MSRPTLRSVPTQQPRLSVGERLALAREWAERVVPDLPVVVAVAAIHYLIADGAGEEPTAEAVREMANQIQSRWEADWTHEQEGEAR